MRLESRCMDDSIENAVLSVLRYYVIFNYPLKADEIFGNLSIICHFSELLVTLEDMKEEESLYMHKGYYSLDANIKEQVLRRKNANNLANEKKIKALAVGKFIYKFPFVRFVGISGSLSKGYADQTSDFDFFIVTETNRLWICRTLLHLFKKTTFLFGQQHKFCMNYFIDMHNMQLEEQNRFTAIELSSMIPVAGSEVHTLLMNDNLWISNHLPNGYVRYDDGKNNTAGKGGLLKLLLEFIINIAFPGKVNMLLMRVTDTKWRKKWARKNFPEEDYNVAFKTTLHVSKNHPANHQKRVLTALSKFEDKNLSV